MRKNSRKLMIMSFIIVFIIMLLPIVFANPTAFNLSITDGLNTANGGETLVTNDNSVQLTWTEPTGNGTILYDIYQEGTRIGADVTAASYQLPIASESDGTLSFYVRAKDVDGFTQSDTVTLTIDRTPADVVTSLGITDGTTNIKGEVSNASDVKLSWTAPIGEPAEAYKIYYYIGTSNPIDITNYSDVVIVGTTADIDISSDGLNLIDGVITFQVTTLDTAGNESAVTEVDFTYDTKAPREINNIVMKDDSNQVIKVDGVSNSNTVNLSWVTPTGEAVDEYIIYVKEGNGSFLEDGRSSVNNFSVSTAPYTDGKLTFKVTTVDIAGNESTGVEIYYTLDTTEPIFSITYELGGSGSTTDISGKVINHAEKNSINVINANNDIASYSVSRTGDNYINGSLTNLKQAIKAVNDDGLYTVKVKDAAGNIASISFTFDQVYPELPTNKQLDVKSVDVEYREGVQADVTIEWEKSSDASLDHYELWINGELYKDDITNPDSGSIISETLTVTTIRYGDVIGYYEVRLYDSVGNYGSYTIQKHITTDLSLPTAEILNTQSIDEDIIFTVDLKDPNRVIDSVYARLYKNGTEVKKIAISNGINEYSFSGLDSGEHDYSIKIQADFDFNGSDYDDEILNLDTIYNIDTLSSNHDVKAEIVSTSSTDNSIDVSVKLTKYDKSDESVTIGVYDDNGNIVDVTTIELDTDDLVTTVDISFTSLTVGNWYQIRVIDTDILATHNFFTQKEVPGVSFKIVEIEQNSISLNIIVKDEDSSSTSLTVVLMEDGKLVPNKSQSLVVGSNNISFSGLDDNTEYEFKIYASYNLQNGRGTVIDDLIGSFEVLTAKNKPSIEIKDIEINGDSIVFDSYIIDDDYSIKSIKAVLYHGTQSTGREVLLNVGLLKNRQFTGLDPLTNYRINIEIEYDLNNSEGVIINQLFYGVDFTTLKTLPSVEAVDINTTNTTADFSAIIIDPTESYISGFAKLYTLDSAVPVQMFSFYAGTEKTFSFTELRPDTTYIIKIDADVNLGGEDGDEDVYIYTKEFTTAKNVNAEIKNIQKTTNTISLDVDVINYIDETITAKFFIEDELIEQFELVHGTNSLNIDGLDEDTTYEIRVEYSNGTKTLLSSNIKTEEILKLTEPEISITSAELNEDNTVLIKVDVTDKDNAFISDRVTIKICNDQELCTIQEIGLSIIASGLKVELPYEVNYISVSMDYDTIEKIGKATYSIDPITRKEIPDHIDPEPIDPDPIDPPVIVVDETMIIAIAVVISLSIVTTAGVIIYTRKNKI
ncbi:hypothetical protein RJG79_01705 [Mycoplasmatota bacterium WC44]